MMAADTWQEIKFEERRELYPDPERVAWILSRYPESEVSGRPGILYCELAKPRSGPKARSKRAEPVIEESEESEIEV
jgi:murein endopeptidase